MLNRYESARWPWITVLDGAMQDALDAGLIGESVASWLASCTDRAVREEIFGQAMAGKLNRDQVKAAVQKANGGARKYQKPEGAARTINAENLRIDKPEDFDAMRKLLGRLHRWATDSSGWDDFRGRFEK